MQVRAHQLVLPPCDVVIRAVADYVRNLQDVNDLEAIAKDIFKHSQVAFFCRMSIIISIRSIVSVENFFTEERTSDG